MRSPTNEASLMTSIRRWRVARRIILGSIVLAGAMATSAANMESAHGQRHDPQPV